MDLKLYVLRSENNQYVYMDKKSRNVWHENILSSFVMANEKFFSSVSQYLIFRFDLKPLQCILCSLKQVIM